MHREEVPRETRAAPVLAADLPSAPNHSALVLALPVNRHEVRVAACLARLPVQARLALSFLRKERLLVDVEQIVADPAPAVRRKDSAFPNERRAAVACVVRRVHPRGGVEPGVERRVGRTRRARLVARWG